jgi:hypothetical protein
LYDAWYGVAGVGVARARIGTPISMSISRVHLSPPSPPSIPSTLSIFWRHYRPPALPIRSHRNVLDLCTPTARPTPSSSLVTTLIRLCDFLYSNTINGLSDPPIIPSMREAASRYSSRPLMLVGRRMTRGRCSQSPGAMRSALFLRTRDSSRIKRWNNIESLMIAALAAHIVRARDGAGDAVSRWRP